MPVRAARCAGLRGLAAADGLQRAWRGSGDRGGDHAFAASELCPRGTFHGRKARPGHGAPAAAGLAGLVLAPPPPPSPEPMDEGERIHLLATHGDRASAERTLQTIT